MDNINQPYYVRADVWLYQGEKASWHFVTIPKATSAQIKFFAASSRRGWGSIPVRVTIGKTSWKTSIFPDSKAGTYLLPLKAEVRKKENIHAESIIELQIEVRA